MRSDTGGHSSLYSAQDAVLLDFDNSGFCASGGTPPPLRQGDATALVFATLSMATCRLFVNDEMWYHLRAGEETLGKQCICDM